MKKIFALTLILAVIFSAPVFASQLLDNASSSDYVTKAPAMLIRGVSNIALSPVEIFVHGYKGTVEGKPVIGSIQGVAEGIYWMVDRGGRGFWDLVTFLAPRYNGAPPTHELEV